MSMTPITRSLFAAGILAVVTVVYSATELPRTHSIANAASAAPFAAAVNAGNAAALPDFSGLVDSYGPAVVNITVTEISENKNRNNNYEHQYTMQFCSRECNWILNAFPFTVLFVFRSS